MRQVIRETRGERVYECMRISRTRVQCTIMERLLVQVHTTCTHARTHAQHTHKSMYEVVCTRYCVQVRALVRGTRYNVQVPMYKGTWYILLLSTLGSNYSLVYTHSSPPSYRESFFDSLSLHSTQYLLSLRLVLCTYTMEEFHTCTKYQVQVQVHIVHVRTYRRAV